MNNNVIQFLDSFSSDISSKNELENFSFRLDSSKQVCNRLVT